MGVVQLGIRVTSDVASGVSGLSKAEGGMGKLKIAAGVAVAAIGTAAVAVGAYAADAVSAAGDLQQSMGAIDTVFQGSAGQMHDWAKSAAQDVGLTQNEFNELGTLIGTQLKNGGTAMEDLAPKTKDLIGLGADLSSMFGGTSKDAVAALSSALKGERDPIEKYGVSLKQASIDAKAAELGFTKVGGSLSDEAQQAATLALIMEQTASAHGNFAKESDTLQGKQQRFAAQMENTKAIIGGALLPVVSQLFGWFNDKLGPILGTLAEQFAAWVGGLDVAGWWANLTDGVGGASSALDGVMGLVAGLVGWFNDSLRPAIEGFAASAGERFAAVQQIVGEFVAGAMEYIGPLVPQIEEIIGTVGTIITTGIELITAVWDAGTAALLAAWELVGPPIIATVGTMWTAIVNIIGPALDVIKGIIKTVLSVIKGDWSGAWDGIKGIVDGAWRLIKGIVEGAINIVKSVISGALDVIKGVWSGAWGGIKTTLSGAWDGIKTATSTGIGVVVGFFRDLPGKIAGHLSGLPGRLYDMGTNMIQGMINGVKDMAGRLVSAAGDVVGNAISAAKQKLGIRSPSRVFAEIGRDTGRGLIVGLGAQASAVARAGRDLVEAAVPEAPTMPLPSVAGGRTFGGGGVQVIVQGDVYDAEALVRKLRDAFTRDARVRGVIPMNGSVFA